MNGHSATNRAGKIGYNEDITGTGGGHMEAEVYADVLFLINAGMDGLCFLLTARILHRKLIPWRFWVGSSLGGVYAVLTLLLDVGQAAALGADVAVCLLLCGLVFGGRTAGNGQFLPAAAMYFLLSMALGGVMTALYHAFNRLDLPALLPDSGGDGIGAWLFLILALAGSGITLWGGRLLRRTAAVKQCRVVVELDGKRIESEGIVDTGNLLRDPLSGRAVICVAEKVLTSLLSPSLAAVLHSHEMASLSGTADARRLRLIPAGTATGGGMLVGFIPDRVEIVYVTGSAERVLVVDAVVAAAPLSDTQALVPAELMG